MNNKLTLQEVADILLLKDIRPIQSYIEKGLIPEIAVDKENFTIDAQILAQKMGVLDFNEPFISEAEAKEILGIDNKSPISYFCKKHGINMYRLSSSGGSKFLFRKSDLIGVNESILTSYPFKLEMEQIKHVSSVLERLYYSTANLSGLREDHLLILNLYMRGYSFKEISEKVQLPRHKVSLVLPKIIKRIVIKLEHISKLIHIFKETNYFYMEPTTVLEQIKYLKKENAEMKVYISKLEKGEIDLNKIQKNFLSVEEIKREELLNTKLIDINFSVRLFNILKENGIKTLRDIIDLRWNDLFNLRKMGKKTLSELEEYLRENNLKFKGD